MRAGTENVPALAGLGTAAQLSIKNLPAMENVQKLRDHLERGILELIPGARVNGAGKERLPNTLNMTLPFIRGESLVLALDQQGVSLSSGSACRSGSPRPSHVLLALGMSEQEAHCSIRISLGIGNTAEEMDRTIALLGDIINKSKGTVRFTACR